jgi:ferredoxin/protein involved in ribonucleotide reduction
MITVVGIYFSPTGNTKKIITRMVSSRKGINFIPLEITLQNSRDRVIERLSLLKSQPDYWIIGMPVYSGKIPEIVKSTLNNLNGNNIPTIGLVTYGNKSYGASLNQINIILGKQNFKVIALGAFIGEHSYSEKFHVAENRPDTLDLVNAQNFGKTIFESNLSEIHEKYINGTIDLVAKLMPDKGPKPFVNLELCNNCNVCVKNCPVNALDENTKMYISKKTKEDCLGCMSCVKKCARKARFYDMPFPVGYLLNRCYFKNTRSMRKEPTLLIGSNFTN